MKQIRTDEIIKGRLTNVEMADILFDKLAIRGRVIKVNFTKVDFKNAVFHNDSEFLQCTFRKCRFWGQYSSIRGQFRDCRFINCEFSGTNTLSGAFFSNCYLSGKLRNVIITDRKQGLFKKKFVFNNCGLDELTFDNINLYGKHVFNDCTLPKTGIKQYRNFQDSLIGRAVAVCSTIYDDTKIEASVIFDRKLKSGQDPIILDENFLASFFQSPGSRKVFDTIVDGFEIKASPG